jgi:hypothetical protein
VAPAVTSRALGITRQFVIDLAHRTEMGLASSGSWASGSAGAARPS